VQVLLCNDVLKSGFRFPTLFMFLRSAHGHPPNWWTILPTKPLFSLNIEHLKFSNGVYLQRAFVVKEKFIFTCILLVNLYIALNNCAILFHTKRLVLL
jgi:hypothetical protein